MGSPNFERLAELGKLPEEFRGRVSDAVMEVADKKKKEVEESNEEDLMKKPKLELIKMCEDLGIDPQGNKKDLIEAIENSKKEEVETKEESVAFEDDLLK